MLSWANEDKSLRRMSEVKKILRIAIGLTLALGLVIGIALPGLAAPNEAEGKALIPLKVVALVRHRVELKQQIELKQQMRLRQCLCCQEHQN